MMGVAGSCVPNCHGSAASEKVNSEEKRVIINKINKIEMVGFEPTVQILYFNLAN